MSCDSQIACAISNPNIPAAHLRQFATSPLTNNRNVPQRQVSHLKICSQMGSHLKSVHNWFINRFNYEHFFLHVNLLKKRQRTMNRFSDWFTKSVHKCEPFLHLWTFLKSVHVLCPFPLSMTSRFVNRFAWTLLLIISFSPKGSQSCSLLWSFFVHSPFAEKTTICEPICTHELIAHEQKLTGLACEDTSNKSCVAASSRAASW